MDASKDSVFGGKKKGGSRNSLISSYRGRDRPSFTAQASSTRLRRFVTVATAEYGVTKLVLHFIKRRPRLSTGLTLWVGMAVMVLLRSQQHPFPLEFPPEEALTASDNTIQGVLQQNYDRKLDLANQALVDNELVPAAPNFGIISHEVNEGETLWHLTKMYQLDAAAIATSNGINARTDLEPGQILYIPRIEGLVYTVDEGDTLASIAANYQVSQADIVSATPLDDGSNLDTGQRVLIPGKVEEILAVRRKRLDAIAAGVDERPTDLAYTVSDGDTLPAISQQFDTSVRALMNANPDVRSTRLQSGQQLSIPKRPAQTYQVQLGDTLESLAQRHDMTVNGLLRANPTIRANQLQVGQTIKIPASNSIVAASPPIISSSGFHWPVAGRVNSGYGWRWGRMHNGVDIPGAYGSPIVAARAGTVISAGWNGGYGNAVKIQHPNGLVTFYAHGTAVYVRPGQTVERGQAIMTRGSTGLSTGPHLHFEVHVDGVPVNPMIYLR